MTGESELYASSTFHTENQLKITGLNGFMSFQGPSLDVAFLLADDYGRRLEAVEGVGKYFAELRREI